MERNASPPRVAIVGAGMAGAACARNLMDAGCAVTVFEKSRGGGGRMATRRGAFDHGAPCFHADDPHFLAAVQAAQQRGLVAWWAEEGAWVSCPEQPSWAKAQLQGATIHTQHTVKVLHRRAREWWIEVAEPADQAEQADKAGQPIGPFDAVLLAIPAIQAAALLEPVHPEWARQARAVPQQAVWTLMATQHVEPPASHQAVPSGVPPLRRGPAGAAVIRPLASPLGLVARQDVRPGRIAGESSWVAHATLEWTQAHLEDAAESVQAALLRALEAVVDDPANGGTTLWAHATVHRWRYGLVGPSPHGHASQPPEPDWSALPCLWDAALGLGLAGDAFSGERQRETGVQRAWLSGAQLSERVRRDLLARGQRAPQPSAP